MGHAGPPRSSTRCGARSHPAVSLPGVPAGAGEGMSPQPPPRGAGCVWGRGCPVLRQGGGSPAPKGASFPLGYLLAAPSALEGSEPRATCVAGQGPGCALGTPGGPPAACPRPLPHLSHSCGTGTARCWAPRAQLWQALRAVLHGPKCPFSPSSPHNPMAIARDGEAPLQAPCVGRGGLCRMWGEARQGQVSPPCTAGQGCSRVLILLAPFPLSVGTERAPGGLPHPFVRAANENPRQGAQPPLTAGPFAQILAPWGLSRAAPAPFPPPSRGCSPPRKQQGGDPASPGAGLGAAPCRATRGCCTQGGSGRGGPVAGWRGAPHSPGVGSPARPRWVQPPDPLGSRWRQSPGKPGEHPIMALNCIFIF